MQMRSRDICQCIMRISFLTSHRDARTMHCSASHHSPTGRPVGFLQALNADHVSIAAYIFEGFGIGGEP